jgi:hypothetical protein
MGSLFETYVSYGFSVVPIPHKQKHPGIAWKHLQSSLPQPGELQSWSKLDTGIGILCGSVSRNLVCLDFDSEEAYQAFYGSLNAQQRAIVESLPLAQSGKGKHLFFIARTGEPSTKLKLRNWQGIAGDILSNGKLAVLPPTLHPTGFERHWIRPLTAEVPTTSCAELGVLYHFGSDTNSHLEQGGTIFEGDRHMALASYAGSLRRSGLEAGEILRQLTSINQNQCCPPLPLSEVEALSQFVGTKPVPSLSKSIRDDAIEENCKVILHPALKGQDDERWLKYGHLFQSAPDYMRDANEGQVDWLVDEFLPMSYLVVLGATSKAGKSCLVTNLAHAVTTGGEFLGMKAKQGAVLWLAYEESNSERAMVLKEYSPVSPSLFITHEKLMLDTTDGIDAVRFWIERTGAVLVAIDPLYGAVKADTLSDGRKARTALEGLKELCRTHNVAAVVLHHFTKNVSAGSSRERFADSNQILATASMDWLMETTPRPDGTRTIKLSGTGRGKFANRTWLIESKSEHEFELVRAGTASECSAEERDEQLLKALRNAPTGLTAEELATRTGQNKKSVQNRLTELVKGNRVAVIGKRGNAQVYGTDQDLLEAA